MGTPVLHASVRADFIGGLVLFAVLCVVGCGWLLYPEGTTYEGCKGRSEIPELSELGGTWTGTVTVTSVNPYTQERRTEQRQLTVTFDRFGRPAGSGSPWPVEWPPCLVAGARVTHSVDACRNEWSGGLSDPWRLPRPMDSESVCLPEVEITPDRFHLVWSHSCVDGHCPGEGSDPPETCRIVYDATLDAGVLNWSQEVSQNTDRWMRPYELSVVSTAAGRLSRP